MILGVAPMDGISDAIFRIITKKIFDTHGDKNTNDLVLWTEFMNVHGYMINPSKVIRHIVHTEFEQPLIAQLYGADEDMLMHAFTEVEDKYGKQLAGLELNMGCPARKVVDGGSGSGMLRKRETSLKIIKKLSKELSLPFSIKTRTGLNDEDKQTQFDYLVELSNYCSMITVHGRTFSAGYTGDADRNFICKLKEVIQEKGNPHCKIIGNGGIKSYTHGTEMVANLDGIMIAQAAIGNPRIFTPYTPTLQELACTILEHLELLAQFEIYIKNYIYPFDGEIFPFPSLDKLQSIDINEHYDDIYFSVIEFRKFLFNYVKGIEGNKSFKITIAQITDYRELVINIKKFFESTTNLK